MGLLADILYSNLQRQVGELLDSRARNAQRRAASRPLDEAREREALDHAARAAEVSQNPRIARPKAARRVELEKALARLHRAAAGVGHQGEDDGTAASD